jgi:hypothetical protein
MHKNFCFFLAIMKSTENFAFERLPFKTQFAIKQNSQGPNLCISIAPNGGDRQRIES